MSHYAKINTVYKYKKELIDSLVSLFGGDYVIVSSAGVPLRDYYGNEGQKANIIVRREAVNLEKRAADLGFVLEDGVYKTVVDNYGGVWKDTMKELPRSYAEEVIKNRLNPYKYRMVTSEKDRIVLEVK